MNRYVFEFFYKNRNEREKCEGTLWMCYESGTYYCHQCERKCEMWIANTDMFLPLATGRHCRDVAWTCLNFPSVAFCRVWILKFVCEKGIQFMRKSKKYARKQ